MSRLIPLLTEVRLSCPSTVKIIKAKKNFVSRFLSKYFQVIQENMIDEMVEVDNDKNISK